MRQIRVEPRSDGAGVKIRQAGSLVLLNVDEARQLVDRIIDIVEGAAAHATG